MSTDTNPNEPPPTHRPLSTAQIKSLRARVLLELVATRYDGIDLVAARAELERRLAELPKAQN